MNIEQHFSAVNLFDPSFYKNRYGLSGSDMEMYDHYTETGCLNNWAPSPHFSPGWFSRRYPDANGSNFLEYYRKHSGVFPNKYWEDAGWCFDTFKQAINQSEFERSLIIVGLFGTGRTYFSDQILQHPLTGPIYQEGLASCGYFEQHKLICSGHATLKHSSSFQMEPYETAKRLISPLRQGHHNILFILRHPFDSLFSNWAWWRRYCESRVPHKDALIGVFGGNDGIAEDIRFHRDAFAAFLTEGKVPVFDSQPCPEDRFLSLEAMLEESMLWLEIQEVTTLHFEQLHQDLGLVTQKIRQIIFPSGASEFSMKVPNSKPYNFRTIFQEHPDIKLLVKSFCSKDIIEKIRILGYSID
jgi:hypothetical protein